MWKIDEDADGYKVYARRSQKQNVDLFLLWDDNNCDDEKILNICEPKMMGLAWQKLLDKYYEGQRHVSP